MCGYWVSVGFVFFFFKIIYFVVDVMIFAMNVTGKWIFKEDFSFGKDEGEAELKQVGSEITGTLKFTEFIDEEPPFEVKCELKGSLNGNKILLHVVSYEILNSTIQIEYFPEVRDGIINANGQIVGSSEDEQGVCGVFILEKKPG